MPSSSLFPTRPFRHGLLFLAALLSLSGGCGRTSLDGMLPQLGSDLDGGQSGGGGDTDLGAPGLPDLPNEPGPPDFSAPMDLPVPVPDLSAPPSCVDGIQNNGESDVDCGGPNCPACADGGKCGAPSDCQSGVCRGGVCVPPSCNDGLKNGKETDVDCGGGMCTPCPVGKGCIVGLDCQSLSCKMNVCAAPDCSDGIKNGNETDVDCGGNCGPCALGKACAGNADCASGECIKNVCVMVTSCHELIVAQPGIASGKYQIDPDGNGGNPPFVAWCDMVSDGGGWTLAMKVDGGRNTFFYGNGVWTNNNVFGAADMSVAEAKLDPYLYVLFSQIRLVMRDGGMDRALSITPSAPSLPKVPTLLNTFTGGGFAPSSNGRKAWLGLLASPSLQTHCGQEGVNSRGPQNVVRIGILGNQENDCNTPDSYIGVGGMTLSSGNLAVAQWDDSGAGGRNTATFSWVFIR